MPPRILVVGSANVDFTVAADGLPAPGETVSGGSVLVTHGGKGANQAVAARRLGAEVRFIACVGRDAAGADIRAGRRREGVEPVGSWKPRKPPRERPSSSSTGTAGTRSRWRRARTGG